MAALVLTVEDGTGVTGANSYTSIAFINNFAAYRGVSLQAAGTPQILNWAIVAMDYIESYEPRFKGARTEPSQALSWPRKVPLDWFAEELIWDVFSDPYSWQRFPPRNLNVNGVWIEKNQIPKLLVSCQCQLVLEQNNGVQLFQTSNPNETVRLQKIGPITTEYFMADNQPLMPAVDALLEPLLDQAASAFLRTVRV